MTMSDKGEKICPLCTEEMDLTDQQLKPCQCGYEICVWCWHHIMDMAEKDETEGRCPACRTAYDKEKIVGMASNCRSAVAEIKVERKQKVQKAKPKASEVRKHLSSVRVFQRNLVHVIGMPLSIADEELLKRREYFGQYGKVLKACISRTASGVIQHSSNDCFSVYITYSKEEEAVRCIQSVHGFTLEDRCLRACFGTTKYCNSWLNNVPCSSQHCLYLHEYGSEQDTFSKEEMTSAFTRVQQTIGASHNMQMRFGNVLPPPADENNNVTLPSIDKPVDKVTLKSVDKHKVSLPDANTKKPCGPLPAVSCVNHIPIWPLVSSSSGLAGPGKQRSALSHDAKVAVLPSSVSSAKKLESDVVNNFKKNEETLEVHSDIKMNPSESTAHSVDKNGQTPSLNRKAVVISKTTPVVVMASNVSPCRSPPKQGFESIATSSTSSSLVEPTKEGSSSIQNKVENTNIDELQRLSLELSSMGVYSSSLEDENYIPDVPISIDSVGAPTAVGANGVLEKENSHVLDDHEPNGSGSFHHSMSLPFSAFNESSNHSRWDSWKFDGSYIGNNNSSDPQKVPIRTDFATLPFSSGKSRSDDKWLGKSQKSFTEMDTMLECSNLVPDFRTGNGMGRFKSDIANLNDNGASDTGESRIISNILSMDGWEDGLTSSNNFAKLFAESDRQHGSDILRNAGKLQNANQSRFLFAQEEDLPIQASKLEHSFNQMPGQSFLRQDSVKNNSPPVGNGHSSFSYTSFSGFDSISRSQCLTSSNMLSVSKPRISTPPGFSASNKAPPPGFSTHERMDLAVGNYSANHLVQTPFFSGGSTQFPTNGYSPSHLDSELNDPAILEIGKGLPITGMNQTGSSIWHNSYAPVGPSDYEARLQHLMQKPAALHQNPKLIDQFDNRFSTPNNVYSPPTFPDYLQSGNVSPFAPVTNQHVRNDKTNGYWGGVNPVNGINHPAISDFYSNESFGLTSNKLVPGYEDAMFRMSGSGNLYNRGFGI